MTIWEEDLKRIIKKYTPKSIIEIGCATGSISTKAVIDAIKESGYTPDVYYGFEYDKKLYEELRNRFSDKWFSPVLSSTVKLNKWMTLFDIVMFYKENDVKNKPPINLVIQWYMESVNYLINNPEVHNEKLLELVNYHEEFDLAIIDGGPFSGESEYNLLKHSKVIVLDDINDIKCWKVYNDLLQRKEFKLHLINNDFCNGYCVFSKI